MNIQSTGALCAQAARPFSPGTWLSTFVALGGGYTVNENSLGLAVIVGDQTDAELALAHLKMANLTAEEKTAIFRYLRASSAQAGRA